MDGGLLIGEVAKRAGVSIDAVRYYERRGLLPAAPRTSGGYRIFTGDIVDRVLFIKQAQELGFSLEEIGLLLTNDGRNECLQVRNLLSAKLAEIDDRLERIRKFRKSLSHYLSECEAELEAHGRSAECPVFTEIAHVHKR